MRLPLTLSSLFLLPLQWGVTVWTQGVAADLPNPCTVSDFRAPVYSVSNFTLNVKEIRDIPKFQLRDEANKFSVQCNWVADPTNYDFDPKPDAYSVFCDPTILQGYPAAAGWYDVKRNLLNVTQWWVCDPKNESYPPRIEAFATINFPKPLSCPNCTIAESRRASSCAEQTCVIADQDIPTKVATIKYPAQPSAAIPPPSGSGKDQPSSVPDNDTPCIGTSFSYPNWDVTDLSFASGGQAASFTLRNHPLNASISCTVQTDGKISCQDGTSTQTRGTFQVGTGELSIDQSWTCLIPGETRPTPFSASGKRILALDNNRIQIIRGTLSKPLNFKPNVYIAGSQSPNCRKLSEQGPSFEIKASTQQVSYGSIAGSGHYGDVVFDLTNNANGLSMHCEAKNAPDLNNCTSITELKWHDCLPPDSGQFGAEQGPITRFTYNVTSQEIVINQTWYCNEDETSPVRFTAVTKPTVLPLHVRRSDDGSMLTSEETRCRIPQYWMYNRWLYIWSDMDKPFTIPAVPKGAVSSMPLPPYSISERKPTGHSCTIASSIAPRLTIAEVRFISGWSSIRPIANGVGYSGISVQAQVIGIRSSAFPEVTWSANAESSTSLVPRTENTNYNQWYECPRSSYLLPITSCSWMIDLEAGYVAFNHTWTCNDKDLNKPISFQSVSSTTFNKTCSYNYDQGNSGSTVVCKIDPASTTLYPISITNNAAE